MRIAAKSFDLREVDGATPTSLSPQRRCVITVARNRYSPIFAYRAKYRSNARLMAACVSTSIAASHQGCCRSDMIAPFLRGPRRFLCQRLIHLRSFRHTSSESTTIGHGGTFAVLPVMLWWNFRPVSWMHYTLAQARTHSGPADSIAKPSRPSIVCRASGWRTHELRNTAALWRLSAMSRLKSSRVVSS
jgi:hypothetical protein